jgi:hypothetical protein
VGKIDLGLDSVLMASERLIHNWVNKDMPYHLMHAVLSNTNLHYFIT